LSDPSLSGGGFCSETAEFTNPKIAVRNPTEQDRSALGLILINHFKERHKPVAQLLLLGFYAAKFS